METLDTLVTELMPRMKKLGYRKNRTNWYKEKDKLSVVFAIQKSQYDADSWWYEYGICVHDIALRKPITISACQIAYRVENKLTAEGIINLLESWESRYGQLRQLQICAIQGKLPGIVKQSAIRYLTSADVSRI